MTFGVDSVLFLKALSSGYNFIFSATCDGTNSFFHVLSNWSVMGCFFFSQIVDWISDCEISLFFSVQCVWKGWYWTITYSSLAEYSLTLVTILRENPAQIESWRSNADLQEQLCPAVTSYESSVFYVYFRVLSSVGGCWW